MVDGRWTGDPWAADAPPAGQGIMRDAGQGAEHWSGGNPVAESANATGNDAAHCLAVYSGGAEWRS